MEDFNMKKFLCAVLAIASIFCLAACTDGKCDECKTEKDVKVYETKDGEEVEYCPSCYAEKVADNFLGGLLG